MPARLRRRSNTTGTGLAKPNTNCPAVRKYSSSGTATVPIGSIWRIGFRLTRPSSQAVLSPKYLAT
jgi:hypothetical protein